MVESVKSLADETVYGFVPKEQNIVFTNYYVGITPKTKIIFSIAAIGYNYAPDKSELIYQTLKKILFEKYGEITYEKGDSDTKELAIIRGNRGIVLTKTYDGLSVDINLKYIDKDLTEKMQEELKIAKMKSMDSSNAQSLQPPMNKAVHVINLDVIHDCECNLGDFVSNLTKNNKSIKVEWENANDNIWVLRISGKDIATKEKFKSIFVFILDKRDPDSIYLTRVILNKEEAKSRELLSIGMFFCSKR